MPEIPGLDALVNWIWQGGVIALGVCAALRVLRHARAADRFLVCAAGLLAVLIVPVLPVVAPAVAHSPDGAAAAGTIEPAFALPAVWWTSGDIVLLALAGWVAVHGIRFAGAVAAAQRLRARCRMFPPAMESGLLHWSRVSGSGRRARLALTDGVRSAAVLGCGPPIIAISASMAARLSPEELDRIVVHEWAHVQRRDDLVGLAQLAVRAAAGWHPAVWWLDRQMRIEREAACDEAAVAVTGSHKGYASSLLRVASLAASEPRRLLAVGVLSSPGLEGRVTRILSHGRLTSRPRSAIAAAMAVAPLLGLAILAGSIPLVEGAAGAVPALRPPRLETPQQADAAVAAPTTPAAVVVVPPPAAMQERLRPRRPVLAPRAPGHSALGASPVPADTPVPLAAVANSAAPTLPAAAVNGAGTPAAAPLLTRASGTNRARPPPPDAGAPPWRAAEQAGIQVGRGSRQAAVTTAGFLTRFGKRIAASF